MSRTSWWAAKVRQFRTHLRARVAADERAGLATWLRPEELALFDAMHVADRRHGLDVVATLRRHGASDPDVLVAGLLHDCGKGDTGVWPRVAWSLGELGGPTFGAAFLRLAAVVPGVGAALARLRTHAATSADLAATAGCSERTVELIRYQDDPRDRELGPLLKLADEAN